MLRNAYCALIVAALGCAYTSMAAASDADAPQQARDRAEIEALMWRYVRALDTFDEKAYAAVYTEDGEFRAGGDPVRGRAALEKMVADIKKGREDRAAKGEPSPPMYHVIANHHVEFIDANHARVHSYWLTVFGSMGQDSPPRIAAAGRGIDELVRVNGQWLIRARTVAPQD